MAEPNTRPPLPNGKQTYRFGIDAARYTVFPSWFEHPSIQVPNGGAFVWPLGTEGFRVSGTAGLGIHKYIGDNAVVFEVAHTDERRIELNGAFPGATGTDNMRELLNILVGKSNYKILRLPGIFPLEQYVTMESYDFTHEETDRTKSVLYTVTFLRAGVGKKVKRRKTTNPPQNPKKQTNKGKPARVFVVREGVRTLRGVAQRLYHNPNRWDDIYEINRQALSKMGIPYHQMPTRRLPLGMKLRY